MSEKDKILSAMLAGSTGAIAGLGTSLFTVDFPKLPKFDMEKVENVGVAKAVATARNNGVEVDDKTVREMLEAHNNGIAEVVAAHNAGQDRLKDQAMAKIGISLAAGLTGGELFLLGYWAIKAAKQKMKRQADPPARS
jgi:hypothetical protein